MLDGNTLMNSTLEILSLLAVAFLLGYLFKLFMGNKWRAVHEEMENENVHLTNELAATNSKIKSLDDNNNYLRSELDRAKRANIDKDKRIAQLGSISEGTLKGESSGSSKASVAASSAGTATVARSTPVLRPVDKTNDPVDNGSTDTISRSTSNEKRKSNVTKSSGDANVGSSGKKSSSSDAKRSTSTKVLSKGKSARKESDKKPSSRRKKDDLTKVEGIGPKIQEIFNKAGIRSFAELGENTPTQLRKILKGAGPRYKMHDPKTWPRQAKYAASGNWKKLQNYQDSLKGGRAG